MKYAIIASRVLLGLVFFLSGLNIVLQLKAMPTLPGDPGTYNALLETHGVMKFVGVLMTIAGLLLLVGRYVPIALVILGPILVNILLFHFLIMHGGAAAGLVFTVLEVFLIFVYRESFAGLFKASPTVLPLSSPVVSEPRT